MYKAWLSDRNSVNASWNVYFENCSPESAPSSAYRVPSASPVPGASNVTCLSNAAGAGARAVTKSGVPSEKDVADHMAVQTIIESYQRRGHFVARVDPLDSNETTVGYKSRTDTLYGASPPFVDGDLDKMYQLPPATLIGGGDRSLPLKDILTRLENAYCRSIGVEYTHLESPELCNWIRERVEVPGRTRLNTEGKLRLFARLARAAGFESFLARKWSSEKRFGLEGCETLIPALNDIVDTSSAYGVNSVFIGMPHRGRLNVLANVCRTPLRTIFAQFRGLASNGDGSGDVKYHLGACVEQTNETTGKRITVGVASNPSHLEAVDPVVQGKTRAEQFFRNDATGEGTMSVLLHGDSAFCGQGVVYETFQLSNLPDYTTHGTVHIVVNNQIGFTADPKVSRSSPYCTDVARAVNAPIFHVNADDPEAVIRVCRIASEWRRAFRRDVVVDLVCYRRNGHNEVDEPMFTQPSMYNVIRKIEPVLDKYTGTLIGDNVIDAERAKKERDDYEKICEQAYAASQQEARVEYGDWLDSPWRGFFKNDAAAGARKTGVPEDTLKHVGRVFSSASAAGEQFVVHEGVERILECRRQMIADRHVDWALAEAMAFGSLLKDGTHVRLSGQDVERGTFSHRHHVLHSQTGDRPAYRPLCHLYADQAPYTVCNSPLSEFAVLGFELGYSMANPNALVCWEAQYGDFSNNAQCVVDQFISSGQTKWTRQTGLVMLLPHGYEGVGPEHSSARLERFLQMSSDDPDGTAALSGGNGRSAVDQLRAANWIVANCSTPANYFHALRRQITLPFRKPLIVMTPTKSSLHHPDVKSSFDEMTEQTEFSRAIRENGPAANDARGVRRLIFCSGRVYYDLATARAERNVSDTVAVCRVEQLSPFPYDLVREECAEYVNADIVWAQEEPKNMGAWSYVQPRFRTALRGARSIRYVGRSASAAPATGNSVRHAEEVGHLLDASFAF